MTLLVAPRARAGGRLGRAKLRLAIPASVDFNGSCALDHLPVLLNCSGNRAPRPPAIARAMCPERGFYVCARGGRSAVNCSARNLPAIVVDLLIDQEVFRPKDC